MSGLGWASRLKEWIRAFLDKPCSRTRRVWWTVVAALYLSSTFLSGPLSPESAADSANIRVGPVYLGRPVVTWGDGPHYLVLVHSLIEDWDFDLSNNYRQAEDGDWDQGTRFRGASLDHHADRDREGRELLTHPPFLPMLLAALVWPLAGTQWVESACIWLTLLAVIGSLFFLPRIRDASTSWPLLLALATPLWVYSRDLWTEPWMLVAWIGLLAFRRPPVQAGFAVFGVLMKYSFAVVPAALVLVALWKRDYRRVLWLVPATAFAVGLAIGVVQYLFQDVDHFSLFHSGTHHSQSQGTALLVGPFGVAPMALPGLLFDPRDGLLFFSPFLIWGLVRLFRGGYLYLPAIAFLLLHATYYGWRGGSGFSARYLVPLLPVLVLGCFDSERIRGARLFWGLAIYALLMCTLAGFLPAAAFDRTPWEIIHFLLQELELLLS